MTKRRRSSLATALGLLPGLAHCFLAAAIGAIFASREIGLRKPERAAFDHVCQETGYDPASLLFFDDTPAKVDTAASYGLHSVLVRGPADVARALTAAGA